jgi:hypothetical protein
MMFAFLKKIINNQHNTSSLIPAQAGTLSGDKLTVEVAATPCL